MAKSVVLSMINYIKRMQTSGPGEYVLPRLDHFNQIIAKHSAVYATKQRYDKQGKAVSNE